MARTGPDRIPNAPLREAFLASPMTASEVARACGWIHQTKPTGADTTMVKRTLGLHSGRTVRGDKVYNHCYVTISIENAKAICNALGLDFDDVYEGHLPAEKPRGGVCACGERMARRAPRCGWCEEEIALGLRAEQSDEARAA